MKKAHWHWIMVLLIVAAFFILSRPKFETDPPLWFSQIPSIPTSVGSINPTSGNIEVVGCATPPSGDYRDLLGPLYNISGRYAILGHPHGYTSPPPEATIIPPAEVTVVCVPSRSP